MQYVLTVKDFAFPTVFQRYVRKTGLLVAQDMHISLHATICFVLMYSEANITPCLMVLLPL